MSSEAVDAVVVGSGPNGLAAAVALAQAGAKVLVLEGHPTPGGGTRTAELTLPGFRHDVCSGCHPMGVLSPYLRTLPLAEHGLEWLTSRVSVAHPLDGEPAVLLTRSLQETAEGLGVDARAYRALLQPFLEEPHGLLADILGPLRFPRHPLALARFGLHGLWPALAYGKRRFAGERARALLGGCACHSVLPLDRLLTTALGLVFLITGHVEPWPVARGGSEAIARALVRLLESLGGRVETGRWVRSLKDLPPTRVALFDLDPRQLSAICGEALPEGYRRRLARYRYGPGAFKLDWALAGPIPWKDPAVAEAATVHLGGPLDALAAGEAAVWRGEHPERPFVLVVQQSALDPSRAPAGKHTGYAYVHVPAGSTVDCTAAIEAQVERFAPGFRERILARHVTRPADLEAYNPSYLGGAMTGGVADWAQLFTRPVARLDPYSTPNPRLYLCSASTPPGGGVHGMCGYFAARSALEALERLPVASLG